MLNEFRQDPISGRWVLFATGRAKNHLGQKTESIYVSKEECVFEDLEKASGDKPILVYFQGKEISWATSQDWTTAAVKNKFPALKNGICSEISNDGLWPIANASGFHELVITRDHEKHFADFNDDEMAEVIIVYQSRFNAIDKDACGKYVLIFHNHGSSAGATIYHNHSQILSLPFIPPGIETSILNADKHHVEHGVSLFDLMIEQEMIDQKRIIFENEDFVVFCPFASRMPYEMRVYPKDKETQFESLDLSSQRYLGQAVGTALAKLKKALNDPDYNFYIHPSPRNDDGSFMSSAYRWHIEIVPRMSVIASVELGTNVFINVVDPDEAAQVLRNV